MDENEAKQGPAPAGGADELLLILREHDTRERVFEAYPDAVVVLDESGAVVDLNRAAADLLGRSRDETVDIREALSPEEPALEARDAWQGRVRVHRPDGTTAAALARSVVLLGEHEALRLLVLSSVPEDPLSQALLAAEDEQRRLAENERAALRAVRAVERRMEQLRAITDSALVHLSLDQLFEELLGRLRELLGADSVTVLLLDDDERVLRIRATSGLEREQEERLEVPLGVGVAGRIAADRRPAVIGDLGRVRAVSPFLGGSLRSLVGVPILLHERVWGVLHAGSVRPRRFTEEDVALLELVASRLAPAIENAVLHETERRARAAAELDAARLRVVETVSRALGALHPLEQMARTILDEVVPAVGATAGAVGVLAEDSTTITTVAMIGYSDETAREWRTFALAADVPAATALRERRLVLLGSEAERDRAFPLLAGAGHVGQAWASLPLVIEDRPIGVVALSFPEPQVFTEHDEDLLSALAVQCSQAMQRAQLNEAQTQSRAGAEAWTRRIALLRSLAARVSSALQPEEVAEVAVAESAAALDAPAAAFLLDDEGRPELLAARGWDEGTVSAWRSHAVGQPPPVDEALRTGRLAVAEAGSARDPASPSGKAVAAIPIVVDERAIGALALALAPSRAIGPEDRMLFDALGRLCGQAMERARLYRRELRTRREAERARDRIERLQELALILADAETTDEVFAALTDRLVVATGAVAAMAVRTLPDGRTEIASARGYPQWPGRTPRDDLAESAADATPPAEAVRTRAGVWLSSGQDVAARFPEFAAAYAPLGYRGGLAALPLKLGDRVLGAVAVQLAETRPWTVDEREFLRAMVRHSAQALARAGLREAEASASREVERRERRYRSLVRATSEVEWTSDAAGAFVESQPTWEAYTGQPWERHRGFGWLDAIHEDDRAHLMRGWLASRDAGEIFHAPARLFHASSGEFRHVVMRAAPVREHEGRILEWVGSVVDVHEERASALAANEREAEIRRELEAVGDRLAFLAAASAVLVGSLDTGQTLRRLAELAVPRLADWCAIEMLGDDGRIRPVALEHTDRDVRERAAKLLARAPADRDAGSGIPWAIRTGRSLMVESVPPERALEAIGRGPEAGSLLEVLPVRSTMVVPIALGDHVFGAMQFVWGPSELSYDREDLALAEDLAHRAAMAMENARLYQAERAARHREARARERLQIFSEAGAAMAESLDRRRMLAGLVRVTANRFADMAAAYTADRSGRVVDVVTAHVDPALDPVLQRAAATSLPQPEDRRGLVAAVLRTGAPAFEPDLAHAAPDEFATTQAQRSLVERLRLTSGLAVPLSVRGRVLGVLELLRSQGSPPFSRDDLDLAAELGRRAGSLLDNAALYAERRSIADTLQRSLLPPDLPEVPGLEVGARYRAAAPGTTVGGDFYDVFEVDLEHWGVVIGDVSGKGVQAAAMMGLARYTVRVAAMSESRPSALLATLNDAVVRQMPEPMFCTAAFARIRRSGDSVRATIAVGGHPLPLVVRTDGTVHAAGQPGTLLGVFDDPTLTDVALDLGPGDALVLYTDGVTEERRGAEPFGEERLRDVLASAAGGTAAEIADAVEDAVTSFRTAAPRDDLAVLVVRVAP